MGMSVAQPSNTCAKPIVATATISRGAKRSLRITLSSTMTPVAAAMTSPAVIAST